MRSVAKSSPILCNPIDLAHQAPLSMRFSRQEYGSVWPFPPPGQLPHKLTEPVCLQRCRQVLYRFSHLGRCVSLKYHTVKPKWNWVHSKQNWKQQAKLEATGSVNVIRGSEHHSLCTPAPPHLTRLLWRKIEDFNPFSFKHYPLYLNLLHSHHPPNFFQQAIKV